MRGRIVKLIMITAVVLLMAFLVLREGCLSLQDSARRASCRPQLLLKGCEQYSKEHDGMFPALSGQFGRLMFDEKDLKVRYGISDYVCESGPNLRKEIFEDAARNTPINDWSYVYLGYFIENEVQGMAFVRAYHYAAGKEGAFEGDLSVGEKSGNCGTFMLFRLRSLDKLPPDASCLREKGSTIPVIVEWPENHRKGGKVVYLDGHQEYVHYPGKFPMTPEFIEALRVIDSEIHLGR